MELEIECFNVESYPLNESESIVLERAIDSKTLNLEDYIIDLAKPYDIDGLSIKQDSVIIPLETEAQVTEFKEIVESWK